MRYGYVSMKLWNEQEMCLKVQKKMLMDVGITFVVQEFIDTPIGGYREREKLLGKLQQGDELVITQLDRISDSLMESIILVETLVQKGLIIYILNIGTINDTPEGQAILKVFKAVKEFGRERLEEKSKKKEGRPRKYDEEKMARAAELLETHTYKEVTALLGMSKSTLIRYMKNKKGLV